MPDRKRKKREETLRRSPGELRWKLPRRLELLRRQAWKRLAMRLADPAERRRLNDAYQRMSLRKKKAFHSLYAKMFREAPATFDGGYWTVEFAGRPVRVPLRAETLWLDWDSALSLLGHDIEIKLTYQTLLDSNAPPQSFLDVGANYGTHSVLHLVHGLTVQSIEPNALCHPHFERYCATNLVSGSMDTVAFGEAETTAQLRFPSRETWLGSLDSEVRGELRRGRKMDVATVSVRRLDDYLAELGMAVDLIKIDTEGYELQVLSGGVLTLSEARPLVLFECIQHERRVAIAELFRRAEYELCALPLLPHRQARSLTQAVFRSSRATNFIALPGERAAQFSFR